MLDHRIYRTAFVPAFVALLIVAFSLGDRPGARTTRIAPDIFSTDRAYGAGATPVAGSLLSLAKEFPQRRPGGPGDAGLAERVVAELERKQDGRSGFVKPGAAKRFTIEADTLDGSRPLEVVMAVREGLTSHSVLVLAHRDEVGGTGVAQLSGTAALLELGRIFAEGDLRRTLVLASVSGGSGGFAGAREVAKRMPGPVDAAIVLGDLASEDVRRPFVIPWSSESEPAPHALRRTVEAGLRLETASDPGGARLPAQWVRRAFPLTLGEQGVLNAAGIPAVLVSATGELGPASDAATTRARFTAFGRGVLRALRAIEDADAPPIAERGRPLFGQEAGVVTVRRLLPDWAIRLLAGALLIPALLTAVDAFFRVRRRGLGMSRWMLWAGAGVLAFVLAWGWMRLLAVTGAVKVLGQPVPPDALPLDGAAVVALVSVALIIAGGWFGLRPLLLSAAGPRGEPAAGGGAAAIGLAMALLVLGVWIFNPYAAFVLLPAAHLWLLVAAPESRLRGPFAVLACLAGFLLPAFTFALLASELGLGPADALWVGFQAFAGGGAGPLSALALATFAGLGASVLTILRGRGRAAARTPDDPIRTRGPRSYAGPGSLGGTESALRR